MFAAEAFSCVNFRMITPPSLILSAFNRFSSHFMSPCLLFVLMLSFIFWIKSRMYPIILFIFFQEEILDTSISMTSFFIWMTLKSMVIFTSASSSSMLYWFPSLWEKIADFQRNTWPWNHLLILLFCFIFKPLEQSSAAFSFVGICCHCKTLELLFIWRIFLFHVHFNKIC